MKSLVLPFLFDATLGAFTPNSEHLPPLNINPDTVTVSGFSSGSFMSAITGITMSDTFKGAGMLNGGVLYDYGKQYWT